MTKAIVNVAIGLLLHQSKVLVGWREAKQHQGNKHEFPGGKVEKDETPEQACTREIFEEVGIGIEKWHIFDVIQHQYDDIEVHLHLFHAFVAEEQLQSIQKPWTWYERGQLKALNFPQANNAIIERLIWTNFIKITDQWTDIHQLPAHTSMYLRLHHELGTVLCSSVIESINQLPSDLLQLLIVNIATWQQLDRDVQKQISAIHYKQHQLMTLKQNDLVVGIRTIAACHDRLSLNRADQLGLDAVILSPVLPTSTHPDTSHLGWDEFRKLTQTLQIPVFALGGLRPADLAFAQTNHAYGIAGISQF